MSDVRGNFKHDKKTVDALLRALVDHSQRATRDGEAAQLAADFYFAHPYSSWERGTNENTNGLVRQYFPKKSEFSKITDKQITQVEARLNNRPRKTLGYQTPHEVFFKQSLVALTT